MKNINSKKLAMSAFTLAVGVIAILSMLFTVLNVTREYTDGTTENICYNGFSVLAIDSVEDFVSEELKISLSGTVEPLTKYLSLFRIGGYLCLAAGAISVVVAVVFLFVKKREYIAYFATVIASNVCLIALTVVTVGIQTVVNGYTASGFNNGIQDIFYSATANFGVALIISAVVAICQALFYILYKQKDGGNSSSGETEISA